MVRRPVCTRQLSLPIALALLIPLLGGPARAHSWYPPECCDNKDCQRIDRISHQSDGSMIVQAGPIIVRIPQSFPSRPSQDGDAHVCTFRNQAGAHQVRCIFLPLNM